MTDTPWISSYPKGKEWDISIKPMPLWALLDHAASRFPSHPAIEFMGKRYQYADFAEQVDKLAAGFQALGIGKGVHVGLFLPNCPAFVISYFAILKAGGTVVNFNPLYSPAEIIHQSRDAMVSVMITANLAITLGKLLPIRQECGIEKLVVVDFPHQLPMLKGLAFRLLKHSHLQAFTATNDLLRWEPLLHSEHRLIAPEIDPLKDIAVLQYTGGTTGTPKGAVLTHANLYSNAMQCMEWVRGTLIPGEERFLGVLPLFHVFAMTAIMNLGIALGAQLILQPRFELKQLLGALKRHRPTAMPGVPAMYNAISQALEKNPALADIKSLKACISGGAPLPVEIKQRFENLTGSALVEGYGLTEASPVCACNPLKGETKAGSIGLPFPATRFSIRSQESPFEALPFGEHGELCISGPQVMRGYWQKPEEDKLCFITDKTGRTWLRTGDIGTMDKQGYVHVLDRLKDMIITNGYKVYPRQVEEALYAHESVSECAVIGEEDPSCGQRVTAFIVLRKDHTASETTLKNHLQRHIAKYALPKCFHFVESLPKSIIGKVLKKNLKGE